MLQSASKLLLFFRIWGIRLTLFKILGRVRLPIPLSLPYPFPFIFVVGCGQFAFSTLAPRLLRFYILSPIKIAYDPSASARSSFCSAYVCSPLEDPHVPLPNDVRLVYICSDHSSHNQYSLHFLAQGVDVYCEKPLTTSREQVLSLHDAITTSRSRFFSGYNRPHSPFVIETKNLFKSSACSSLHLQFSILAHFLPGDHWYRKPGQGSRIYGNLGHWVDLAVHSLFWLPDLPDYLSINILYLDDCHNDENFVLTLRAGQVFSASIYFSARHEPASGVYENIAVYTDKFTARIDNFKSMSIDNGASLVTRHTRIKSAGHRQAILQPFSSQQRPSYEYLLSELLLAEISDLVLKRNEKAVFDLATSLSMLR